MQQQCRSIMYHNDITIAELTAEINRFVKASKSTIWRALNNKHNKIDHQVAKYIRDALNSGDNSFLNTIDYCSYLKWSGELIR